MSISELSNFLKCVCVKRRKKEMEGYSKYLKTTEVLLKEVRKKQKI